MEERMPTFLSIAKALKMDVHHVETVPHGEASFLVKDPKIVFLDHDLGGKTFVDSNKEQTGVHLARWIKQNDENFRERIIIAHSMNPMGAKDMVNELDCFASRIPFRDIRFYEEELISVLTGKLKKIKM